MFEALNKAREMAGSGAAMVRGRVAAIEPAVCAALDGGGPPRGRWLEAGRRRCGVIAPRAAEGVGDEAGRRPGVASGGVWLSCGVFARFAPAFNLRAFYSLGERRLRLDDSVLSTRETKIIIKIVGLKPLRVGPVFSGIGLVRLAES